MSTRLVDTNVVSFLMKRHTLAEVYRRHLEGHVLAISFMTVGELFEGALRASWASEKFKQLEATLRDYTVIPSDLVICRKWGEVRSIRRRQPISAEDAWIAATAIAYGCPLVTHDAAGFHGIPELAILTEG